MRAAWDEANRPVTSTKETEFERFVRERLFPSALYDLMPGTHDDANNSDEYLTFLKHPCFKFRSKNDGRDFYVEAKYYSKYQNGRLEWCNAIQLKRYQEIDNITPVMIILGMGGHPSVPEATFLVPVKHIKFAKLPPSFLSRYRILTHHSINPGYLKNII
jgi:hypothetical protein